MMTTALLLLILIAVLGPTLMEGLGRIFLFGAAWAVVGFLLTWAWTFAYGPIGPLWPLLVTGGASLFLTAWLFSLRFQGRP